MKDAQQVITRNMLQFCYTCQDAHACDTERECVECWKAKGMLNREEQEDTLTTEELLHLYTL